MTTENKMGTMPVPRLVFSMGLPLAVSLLVQSLYNIVDGIFVSRISEEALAATSLAFPVQFLIIAVSVGSSLGLNSLLSWLLGKGRKDDACRAATTGLICNLVVALCFSLIGIFGARGIADSFTDNREIADLCFTYLRICVIFSPGMFLEKQGQRMLQAVGNTTLSMVSQFIGAGVNLILDPILIFGLLGSPALGIQGAAIATVAGQWLAAFSALLFNRIANPDIHIRLRGYRFNPVDAARIYRVGAPSMFMQIAGSLMFSMVNALLITVSPTAVAFFGVYYKLQSFLMMTINGFGQATIPIAGYNYGARKPERIREAWHVLLFGAAGFSLVVTGIFLLFPRPLLALFAAGEEMMRMGVPALRIIAVTFAFGSVTMATGFFVSGLGNGMIGLVGSFLRQVVLLIPCFYLFRVLFGFDAVWYAFWPAEILACAVTILLTRRELAKKLAGLSVGSAE
ncbi:MAG: MATE family efflux transporter [Firmicutes bacterium]|nr:MATE family efflux transporter [Bacillota bacterium]